MTAGVAEASPARRAEQPSCMTPAVERGLFAFVALLAAATLWIAPRPPMSDLPQHAGQVALWRDLLIGDSRFGDLVAINLLTPYLIGYGLALPLSFVIGAGDATRIVLTAAFFAWLWQARGLRRDLGGDPRVDWLFFFGYFGVAWVWGFYTFLVAAPLVLVFARCALRHARAPTVRNAAVVVAAGCAVLLSHGLQFLFAGLLGAALLSESAAGAWRAEGPRAALAAALRRVGPYILLLALFIAFMVARRLLLGADPVGDIKFVVPVWRRPPTAIGLLWDNSPRAAFMILSIVALAAPLRMGLTPRLGPALALFLAVVAVELFLVDTAFGTGFIYQRFALYIAPFWAMTLRPAPPTRQRSPWAHAVLIGCAAAAVALHAARVAAFAREDAAFSGIVAEARRGERILALTFDPSSPAFGNAFTYLDWGGWLQADRGAFIDFNMAAYPPQPVRFRPAATPKVGEMENWSPQLFDWKGWDADLYDAILVRGSMEDRQTYLFPQAPCPLEAAASAGDWTLYRKTACTK